MSRFLILSEGGDGVGLALRLQAEGHDAKLWHRDPSCERHGKGLIEFATDYQMGQTIVADCTGFGILMDKFRDEGLRTFAGSTFADKLEADRQFAEEVMERADIKVPLSKRAKSWDEARKIIMKMAERSEKIVLKPEGALSGNVPSYVASDAEDAIKMLDHFQKNYMASEIELTVQEFIDGLAISTEGWFNGTDWIPGMFNHTIERKQFLDGDLGPSGGCSGNLVWACKRTDAVVRRTLLRITELLQERRYIGPIDINCVVNDDGIYGLEFTPRFGYDAFPTALYGLMPFNFGQFIDDSARDSEAPPTGALADGFAAGVRITLPPYPDTKHEACEGIPVRGFAPEDKQWFYPYNVAMVDEELQSSGGAGILGVLNGSGECIGEAFAKAYEILLRLKIPEVQYRTDLCEQFRKDFRQLQAITEGKEYGWYGVDLDGTLAEYSGYKHEIGEPVPRMVYRVKRWLSEGKEVRILTARGTQGEKKYQSLCGIYAWCREHIGQALEVTDRKDPEMIRLYDDRVRQVEEGTGELVTA